MPLDSMITQASASVAKTQPCSTSISERPPTPAMTNPKMFPMARKTVAPVSFLRRALGAGVSS
jgi:hypothetical protein